MPTSIKVYNKQMNDDFNQYHTLSEVCVLCVGMNYVWNNMT